ncbi:MAG TPA: hypothetical protein PKC43_00580 [Phycisphaerales bacterium]|nr:hypothetical protein [Phycisphaerales bacterium]HMP35920.1 hypothetical protein [Phycisphaerales bacterium]
MCGRVEFRPDEQRWFAGPGPAAPSRSPEAPRGDRPIVSERSAIIAAELHCRGCGYDLKALPLVGRCPECGLAVVETVTQAVDPEASALPRLRDPEGTGDGLLGLSIAYLLGAGLVIVPPALGPLALITTSASDMTWPLPLPPRAVAALVGIAALWWLWLLARAPAEEPAREAHRYVRRAVHGQLAWIVAVVLPVLAQGVGVTERVFLSPIELVAAPAAILALKGFSGVLGIVGLRSRAYRNARGGRQSIDLLIWAIVIMAACNLANAIGEWRRIGLVEHLGSTLYAAVSLLLLVGLTYLVVNCWWIRTSLRKPPPRLDELIGPAPSC